MATSDVKDLIKEAKDNRYLRTRLSQDRSPEELVESIVREGHQVTVEEARKILAGALLTSDQLSQKQRTKLMGGLSWGFVSTCVDKLDGDYSLLDDRSTWLTVEEFYDEVFSS